MQNRSRRARTLCAGARWLLLLATALTPALATAESGEADKVAVEEEAVEEDAKPATETFPSGLAITHIAVGDGASPSATDVVQVHYHGTFEDGRVFDSSVERGQPAEFPLNRVIRCWTEGVQKMAVGGKARLLCPPGIAYGARGAPPRIPPNSTLFFDVELLGIR